MSNSATSAAKRRRAGPLLSSPLFQSPQSFQSNKIIPDNNLNLQPERQVNAPRVNAPQPVASEQQPVPDSKFMTIQQVINLITTRLISVENFVNEFGDKPRPEIQVNSQTTAVSSEPVNVDYDKIAELCKSIMDEHVAEFDHRYAILAEEIANMKNVVLSLQNYTLEVNKKLMDEYLQKKDEPKEEPKAEPKEEPKEEPNEEPKEEQKAEPKEEQKAEPKEEPKEEAKVESEEETKAEESVPHIEFHFESEKDTEDIVQESANEDTQEEDTTEDPFSINIVSKKKGKKGKQGKHTESSKDISF